MECTVSLYARHHLYLFWNAVTGLRVGVLAPSAYIRVSSSQHHISRLFSSQDADNYFSGCRRLRRSGTVLGGPPQPWPSYLTGTSRAFGSRSALPLCITGKALSSKCLALILSCKINCAGISTALFSFISTALDISVVHLLFSGCHAIPCLDTHTQSAATSCKTSWPVGVISQHLTRT